VRYDLDSAVFRSPGPMNAGFYLIRPNVFFDLGHVLLWIGLLAASFRGSPLASYDDAPDGRDFRGRLVRESGVLLRDPADIASYLLGVYFGLVAARVQGYECSAPAHLPRVLRAREGRSSSRCRLAPAAQP
jgi:hypothetical protein